MKRPQVVQYMENLKTEPDVSKQEFDRLKMEHEYLQKQLDQQEQWRLIYQKIVVNQSSEIHQIKKQLKAKDSKQSSYLS